MANIAPANFSYVNANGDKGDVQVLSDADITLLNTGLQDIEDLKLSIQKPLPSGTLIHYAGETIPEGFLLCNGVAVSRTTYANLFAAIGTLYGAGDGSTTFNLPDARDRVLQGASSTYAVGTSIAAGLPNVTGSLPGFFSTKYNSASIARQTSNVPGGSFNADLVTRKGPAVDASATYAYVNPNFAAVRSSAYYGASTKPQVDAISSYTLIRI